MKISLVGVVGSFDVIGGVKGGLVVDISSEGLTFSLSFAPCGLFFRLSIISFICLFAKYTLNKNKSN